MSMENVDYKRGYDAGLSDAVTSIRMDRARWHIPDGAYDDYMRGYDAGIAHAVASIRSGFMTCHITDSFDCSVCFYHFPTSDVGGITFIVGKYPRFCPQCGCKVKR